MLSKERDSLQHDKENFQTYQAHLENKKTKAVEAVRKSKEEVAQAGGLTGPNSDCIRMKWNLTLCAVQSSNSGNSKLNGTLYKSLSMRKRFGQKMLTA